MDHENQLCRVELTVRQETPFKSVLLPYASNCSRPAAPADSRTENLGLSRRVQSFEMYQEPRISQGL